MLSITLIISLIVFIFLVLCIMYYNTTQSTTQSTNYSSASDIDIENKTQLLELMNEAKNNAKEKIKNTREKFSSLEGALTKDEANAYLSELNFLNYWLQNNSGSNGIMGQIHELVQYANDVRTTHKKVLVDILTNMFFHL